MCLGVRVGDVTEADPWAPLPEAGNGLSICRGHSVGTSPSGAGAQESSCRWDIRLVVTFHSSSCHFSCGHPTLGKLTTLL